MEYLMGRGSPLPLFLRKKPAAPPGSRCHSLWKWEVSRVHRRNIRKYSPGIGSPNPFRFVSILYHNPRGNGERIVKRL